MKLVYDNGMVAHIWANQSQAEARSHNGNFSFRGADLYSYSTCIATLIKNKRGTFALVTPKSYSMTTSSKHKPAMWSALRGTHRSFVVSSFHDHAANLAELIAAYDLTIAQLKRKRDLDDYWLERLKEQAETVHAYNEAFKVKRKLPYFHVDKAWDEVRAYRAEREARNNTPAKLAAKERARERKRALHVAEFRAGKNFPWKVERIIERSMTDEDKEARRAAIRLAQSEKIAAWYRGEPNGLYFDADCGGAALRVRGDLLETSHAASVPLDHAKRAFRFLKLCREQSRSWERNGHSLRVGHFTIDRVEPDGSFRAGCHEIKWPEVERVAKEVGVFDEVASDTTEPREVV